MVYGRFGNSGSYSVYSSGTSIISVQSYVVRTMCRLMDGVFPPELKQEYGWGIWMTCVSEHFVSHIKVLRKLAIRLQEADLTLNIKKSQFTVTAVKYLGFVIGLRKYPRIQTKSDRL